MRPNSLDEVIGHDKITGKDGILRKIINSKKPTSLIFWGPAGIGKTTLARILANELNANFIELSAVTAKKQDVTDVIKQARINWNLNIRTILFVDEIHRFNKAQQDSFLPHVESGLITLIGATTENPSFEVIPPLLSRTRVIVLDKLKNEDLEKIIENAFAASQDYTAQKFGERVEEVYKKTIEEYDSRESFTIFRGEKFLQQIRRWTSLKSSGRSPWSK